MRNLLTFILVVGLVHITSAQYRSGGGGGGGGFNPDNLYFGGGFGLSIGTAVTNVSVSPLVGYNITDALSAGTSFTYQYLKYADVDESFNSTGFSLFSRFLFTDELFAHAEYEHMRYDRVVVNLSTSEYTSSRQGNNSMFVGLGYRQDAGRSAAFYILGLYDLNWKNEDGLYPIPYQVRAGFIFGF